MNEQLFPFFFFCWIEQRQEKQVKEKKKKGVLFQTKPRLDERRIEYKKKKKRHFRNNPSTAAPGDSRIGWGVIATRGEEGGNKLDRAALIFHFDEGGKSSRRWNENRPNEGSRSSSP